MSIKAIEMTAIEFLKWYRKMCESSGHDCCNCPFFLEKAGRTCRQFMEQSPHRAIEIIWEYKQKHEPRTMIQDLMQKLPNVQMHRIGVPMVCPCHCGYENDVPEWCKTGVKTEKCFDCWDRPAEVKK